MTNDQLIQECLDKDVITKQQAVDLAREFRGIGHPVEKDCSMDPECDCEDCQSEHWSFDEFGAM